MHMAQTPAAVRIDYSVQGWKISKIIVCTALCIYRIVWGYSNRYIWKGLKGILLRFLPRIVIIVPSKAGGGAIYVCVYTMDLSQRTMDGGKQC